MGFSREDLTVYEKQPAAQVDDKSFDPFNPTAAEVKAEATPETSTEEVVAEPAEQVEDGSTTETEAEPVAAEAATPGGEKDPDTSEDLDLDGAKPRSRAQERIEELVAERNALRKYGEYLLTQVDEMRKAPKGAQSPPAAEASQAEVKEDPVPTLESAEFDPVKFAKLQNDWIQRQVDKRVDSVVKTFETRQNENAVRQAFETRTTEFRKTAPDFDVVIANPALPALAPQAAKVVVRSENGPAIAYHLAKNPDLATRIARMEPELQSAAIGRLEEQILRSKTDVSTQKEPSTKVAKPTPAKVTKAPPPPKPVSTGSGVVSKEQSAMSMDEWVANERSRKITEKQQRQKVRAAMR